MVKISFEYTIIKTSVTKVVPKITSDESTTMLEKIIANNIELFTMQNVKDSKLIEENNVIEILSNIGKK
jgi:hypothetical protein